MIGTIGGMLTPPKRARFVAVVAALCAAGLAAACTTGSSGRPDDSAPTPATAGPSGSYVAPGSKPPNIVFILTDDLSSNLVPYMPAVQQMKKLGVSMSNHFVVNSLCCPSRASIFTGQYPHNTHVVDNDGADGGYDAFHRQRLDRKSFPLTLQQAGYRTAFMGKYLNGYDPNDGQPDGFDQWFGAGDAYFNFNYTLDENGQQVKYGERPKDYLTDVMSGKAGDFVNQTTREGKPFFLEVATFAPHAPWTPAPRDRNKLPGLGVPQTPAFGRVPTDPPAWMPNRKHFRPHTVARMGDQFRKRAQSVRAISALITDLRDVLKHRGVLDNTYFVFTSDNGFHIGEHGLTAGKQTAFDTDIQVPLVVTGPGIKPGSTVSAMTSSIDFAPTFEAIAGRRPPSYRDGVSMLPLWRTGSAPPGWQRSVLVEHHGHSTPEGDPDHQTVRSGYPPSYSALRTEHTVYVEYSTGEREFYDMRTDPYQNDNIYRTAPKSELEHDATVLHQLTACAGATKCQAAARE